MSPAGSGSHSDPLDQHPLPPGATDKPYLKCRFRTGCTDSAEPGPPYVGQKDSGSRSVMYYSPMPADRREVFRGTLSPAPVRALSMPMSVRRSRAYPTCGTGGPGRCDAATSVHRQSRAGAMCPARSACAAPASHPLSVPPLLLTLLSDIWSGPWIRPTHGSAGRRSGSIRRINETV